jgi:pectin methylesterase-like acyl-CoA thioesterase
MKLKTIAWLSFFMLAMASSSQAYDLVVAQDGSGNYSTVQAAINAAPTGQTVPYTIYIKNGKYKEKITIPSNKPFLQLIGESVANVVLTYDDYAGRMLTCNTTVGTQNSASFTVNANDFAALNITFENAFGDGSQAVAVLVNADRAAFKNCRFLANQDTLYLKGAGTPKAYFKNCYIDGNVDFIFGSSIALFDSCVVYAKTRGNTTASYITAPNTPLGQAYGFVFRDARFPMNNGNTLYYLSRPWPSPDVPNTRQKCVLLASQLSGHIQPTGWSTWDANTVTANVYYGEYASRYFNNSPANISQRVSWSFQLTQADSSSYTLANLFGSWDPCTVLAGMCSAAPTDIAVSNFKGTKDAATSNFSWNISWPMIGITYNLFRSTDGTNYSSVYSTTAANDTAINFAYTDNTVPPSGSMYYYYINASKPGYVSHTTDTIKISNAPQVSVTASAALYLCGFNQALGTPSAAQTYTVAGTNLTGNLTITPPVNYEVSTNQTAWFTNAAPLSLAPNSGTIATTTIYVRLNAAAVGSYSGDIVHTAAGTSNSNTPVSGVTVAAPTSVLLQQWPLTANKNDSAGVRSAGVTASTATLNNLFESDGSAASANIPPFSGQYGQVLGANAAGNNWSSVGGTLRRTNYEQFTVTAAAGSNLRIDSITFLSDFYLTTSSIRMGVAYSKNGFTAPADSAEILNGISNSGTSLVLGTSGTFTRSFPILRNDAGPINYYALSLNGTNGITLNANETLTIRLYWSCSSTGTPRFAFLKNVKIMGVNVGAVPLQLLSFRGENKHNNNLLHWQTDNESNVDFFEVQRSIDGNQFEKMGSVLANNRAGKNQYNLTDNSINGLGPIAYYRLKMVDKDGRYSYSPTVIIKLGKIDKISLWPNPAVNQVQITLPDFNGEQTIQLRNQVGQLLTTLRSKGQTTSLPVGHLPKGIYWVQITDRDGNNSSQKLIVQ